MTVPTITDIVVIPDAGSNQVDEQSILSRTGKQVLIMDHHNVSQIFEDENVIIVNNQTSEAFHNKELSGAGVVFKVIQAYDEVYGKRILYKRFEDLAALGIIADCMDVRTLDNNAIIMNGLSNIRNNMFKALIEHQAFHIKKECPWKVDVAFYIAPLINAVIRSGSIEEKTQFFEGFINTSSEEVITSVTRGRTREETLYQFLARTASNMRARQNTRKEKAFEALKALIEKNGYQHDQVIILTTDEVDVPMTITGLIAMEIVNEYKRPTLLLRPVKEGEYIYYRGSGRGLTAEGFYSFQKVLLESGMMDYCEGHDNAFGASVLSMNIEKLRAWLNERLKDVSFGNFNEVDCCIDESNWNPLVLKEFGEMMHVFGSGLPQPKFHFDLTCKGSDVRVQGQRQDSLRISYKGVAFIAFQNKALVEQFLRINETASNEGKRINFEIIGTSEINEYNGYKNVQILIKDIEMKVSETDTLGAALF